MQPKPVLPWQCLPGHRRLEGRAGHTATLVGERIFVLGGRNGNRFFNDLWVLDTRSEQWTPVEIPTPFAPRAYHTATLVSGTELWVIGGSDHRTMFHDVHIFHVPSLKWSSPVISGEIACKRRGTHAAVLHPLRTTSILVYGGYGGVESCWLNDLVVLHTDTLEWEELAPLGVLPSGRGYHSLTVVGCCVALFGGKGEGGIVKDGLSIYDASENRWMIPIVGGEAPLPRSNHAAVLFEDNLVLIHGGRHGTMRLSDSFVLEVPSILGLLNVNLRWRMIERNNVSPSKGKATRKKHDMCPGGRSAHSLVAKGHTLYVIGGYGGHGVTFNDILVLHDFLNAAGLDGPKRKQVEVADDGKRAIEVGDGSDEETEEGWRSTKGLPSHSLGNIAEEKTVFVKDSEMEFRGKKKSKIEAAATKSNKAIAGILPCVESKKTDFPLANQSLAMLIREKELYKIEVNNLQRMMESLKETLKEKDVIESALQAEKLQLQKSVDDLQNTKKELQCQVDMVDCKMKAGTERIQDLEKENENIKSNAQGLRLELSQREKELYDSAQKASNQTKKYEEVLRLLEETKSSLLGAVCDRDELKSCVQRLERELEKQMEALQQVSSRYETEKSFLVKEINERKITADRLFTELGGAKESSRALEESVHRQSVQLQQEAARMEALRKEKEDLNQAKAVMAMEIKQLAAEKRVAESNCEILQRDLQSKGLIIKQAELKTLQLQESAEKTKEHVFSLHESLKKKEDDLRVRVQENDHLKALLHETEDFIQSQLNAFQAYSEKLRCARQSCPL